MKHLPKMPSTPKIMTCEKHGDYEAKYMNSMRSSGGVMVFDHCMTCVSEKEAEDKIKQKEGDAARDIENEKRRRESARVNAGISKRNLYKTFDAYDCSNEGQTKAKNDCVRYVSEFPHEKSMLMVGGVGTGKTLLASAMLDKIVDDHRCRIVKLIDLVRSLKATWAKDSEYTEEWLIDWYSNIDLLIIDEVGSQFGSDTEKLFVFDIIDGRYQNMKPTVLISNLDIDGIKDAIGERCVDRLREGGGMMVAFDWSSSRV